MRFLLDLLFGPSMFCRVSCKTFCNIVLSDASPNRGMKYAIIINI